jgi:hypothetical protein
MTVITAIIVGTGLAFTWLVVRLLPERPAAVAPAVAA